MTHTERTRFIILFVLLVLLIGLGVLVNRFQQRGSVGADALGQIQNQAVATFKDDDGIEQTSLSEVNSLRVLPGNTRLVLNYNLGKRSSQNAQFDVQFFNTNSGQLLTTLRGLNGQQGVVRSEAKNVPNGTYDISAKPTHFLSQSKKGIAYSNGTPTTIDFEKVFKWGDIDVSHNGKGDNVINNADWARLVAAWGSTDQNLLNVADYNGDGHVNNVDASVLLGNWGPPGEQFQVEAAEEASVEVPAEFE